MAKQKFGDRKDARRVRDIDGLHSIFMHIMPKRTEAEVFLQHKIDVTELMKFVEEKNRLHPEYKTTAFHCVVTGIGRVAKMRPLLNRFIAGRHLYERDDITLSFVAKRKFQDHAEEALMTLTVRDDMNIETVTKKIVGDVHQIRSEEHATDGLNKTIDQIGALPSPILRAFIGLLQWLSAHGLLPDALTDGDTNHTTVLLSNLGSIQCSSCYHHLNNYGTNSIMITVGYIHKEPTMLEDGSIIMRDIMDLGFTADERIADGFYFARSLKLLEHLLTHPELLDIPMKEEIDYEL